jgi:hypothetical protein
VTAITFDYTLHITSTLHQNYHIDGFYAETGLLSGGEMVYVNGDDDIAMYLYFHPSMTRWMVGRMFSKQDTLDVL